MATEFIQMKQNQQCDLMLKMVYRHMILYFVYKI